MLVFIDNVTPIIQIRCSVVYSSSLARLVEYKICDHVNTLQPLTFVFFSIKILCRESTQHGLGTPSKWQLKQNKIAFGSKADHPHECISFGSYDLDVDPVTLILDL